MTGDPPDRDQPPLTLKPSSSRRHELNRITSNTYVKRENSIALPGIDTQAEIALIQAGHGVRVGDSRYRIHGRTYVHKPDGATYPESGEGIVRLTNPQFRALRLLITHGGRSVEFIRATERDPTIRETDVVIALDVFRLRKDSNP